MFQNNCIPSLISVKTFTIFINNYYLEKVEAFVVLYGFLWRFDMQYQLQKSSCSLLNRTINDEMNDLWSWKSRSICSFINVANSSDENWLPLSDTICAGIPLREHIELRASIVFVDVVVFISTSSGHFEWASTKPNKTLC